MPWRKYIMTLLRRKGNWWYWEIGIPLSLNSIFTLMYDYADKSQLKRYMAAERHFNDRIKLTGANRLWESVILPFAEYYFQTATV